MGNLSISYRCKDKFQALLKDFGLDIIGPVEKLSLGGTAHGIAMRKRFAALEGSFPEAPTPKPASFTQFDPALRPSTRSFGVPGLTK